MVPALSTQLLSLHFYSVKWQYPLKKKVLSSATIVNFSSVFLNNSVALHCRNNQVNSLQHAVGDLALSGPKLSCWLTTCPSTMIHTLEPSFPLLMLIPQERTLLFTFHH